MPEITLNLGGRQFSGTQQQAFLAVRLEAGPLKLDAQTSAMQDLERVVLLCLAKDAADRFPDAESLEKAMAEADCVKDWDRDRAAEWWKAADRAHVQGRDSRFPTAHRVLPPDET